MNAETNFASAEIELVLHATEDRHKILSVIERMLGIKSGEFAVSSIKGHFGNEITVLKAYISSRQATEIAYKISEKMSSADRMHMHDNFDLYLDEKNSLYVRISKQRLFEQKIVLAQEDSLKIKLKTVRRFQPKSEMENYKKLLVRSD